MNDILSGPGWYVCHTNNDRVTGVLEKWDENKEAAMNAASQYTEPGVRALYRDKSGQWYIDKPKS